MVHLFKEGFTPLYKVSISNNVLKQDLLDIKYCHALRGPKGHCFSRSKHFNHYGITTYDANSFDGIRLILNRELLTQRYRIYPIDEFFVGNGKNKKNTWFIKHDKQVNKANFPYLLKGKVVRQPKHGLKCVDFKDCSMEMEFEERILTNVTNLGKYIYGINFCNNKEFNNFISLKENKKILIDYLLKYPNIKILIGFDNFTDNTNEFKNSFG